MKLLLDENIPHRLRPLLVGHDCYTVAYLKWVRIRNGDLLKLAAANGFDALITKDTGIPYEQHLPTLPCALVVLRAKSNSLNAIEPLIPELLQLLDNLPPQQCSYVG